MDSLTLDLLDLQNHILLSVNYGETTSTAIVHTDR